MFPVVTVDPRFAESPEQLGTKRKFWFDDGSNCRRLFKAEERGTGEDWAEKLTCEFAGRLGVPHVSYELAVEIGSGTPGVVCATCSPPPWSLVLGNQLLLARVPDYPAADSRKYAVREHTVAAVVEVIGPLNRPPADWLAGVPSKVTSALGVFVGYLMLDAWVANQDRHHQNWAALSNGGQLCLAPTFDHGAAMARNLTDDERRERLATRDRNRQIPAFAARARSAFYGPTTGAKPLHTFEAWRAIARHSPDDAATWLEQLAAIDDDDVGRLLEEVPPTRMSSVCRDFTRTLLVENKKRLLAGGGV